MERNALQKLTQWNDNSRRKPLIVWGGATGRENLSR